MSFDLDDTAKIQSLTCELLEDKLFSTRKSQNTNPYQFK